MVEKIINKVVSVLVEEELIYEDEREKYIYAYTCILEKFITITCILFISILKGDFLFTIIFLLAFFSLRRRTGGFHLNSFSGCFIGTVSVSIAISRISRIFVNKIPVIILLDIVSFLIILIKGTVNHPNIQMNNDELLVSKKKLE